MTWTGMVVVLGGTAFLVGSRADGETPTAAPLHAIAEPQPRPAGTAPSEGANEDSARSRSPRPSTRATAGARRFAWAPVAGSTGYHVELFRGSTLVFRDETTKPEIVIRKRWRLDGRLRRLEPGSYRWYVWRLVNGRRTASAIVQARLVVPPA